MPRIDPYFGTNFRSITDYNATSGIDCTAALNEAAADCSLLHIPAGNWTWTGSIAGSSRVTWMIDPGAQFPDAPTYSAYNLPDLSSLGGRVMWHRNIDNSTYGQQMGLRLGGQNNWAETLRPFSLTISELTVVAKGGEVAMCVATRSSDNPIQNESTIGYEAIVWNDNVINKEPAWGAYLEITRESGAGRALGLEIDTISLDATIHPWNPYSSGSIASQESVGLWIASGGGNANAKTSTAAMVVLNNGAAFEKGIVFNQNALDTGLTMEAVAMQKDHQIAWYTSTGKQSWLKGDAAVFTSLSDTAATGVQWDIFRKHANGTDATANVDELWRMNFWAYTGSGNYSAGYIQALQRGTFSGGNVRTSIDIAAANTDGTQSQVTLNGIANKAFTAFPSESISSGDTSAAWLTTVTDTLMIKDGVSAPSTVSGWAVIYVDTADGDLKVKFGDGTVKTIVVDT